MARITRRGVTQENAAEHVAHFTERHAQAEKVQKDIESMAFPTVGEKPGVIETFAGEDPAAIGFSAPMGPSMLTHEQTLRKWEVPDLPPSHKPGFGSSTEAEMERKNTREHPLEREVAKLSQRMAPSGHPDPLGQLVANRRGVIQQSLESGDPDSEWYQGKAQALIYHHAQEQDVSVPTIRKTTASYSPKMPWDQTYAENKQNIKAGRAGQTTFPNVEQAAQIVGLAKGRSPEQAVEATVAARVQGAQRKPTAELASRMLTGEHKGHEPLPVKGEGEKTRVFEVNLSDPTHPVYGYSAYVHRHQMSGHTPDVQDARAAGFHEDLLEVPRPISQKTGEPTGKPHHEEMLQRPAGTDIAVGTATVARTEEFEAQRAQRGEEWARQNAIHFMPAPAQSMQWSIARESGTVDIPEDIKAEYANRPKPSGFPGYHGSGTKMTKRDWKEV